MARAQSASSARSGSRTAVESEMKPSAKTLGKRKAATLDDIPEVCEEKAPQRGAAKRHAPNLRPLRDLARAGGVMRRVRRVASPTTFSRSLHSSMFRYRSEKRGAAFDPALHSAWQYVCLFFWSLVQVRSQKTTSITVYPQYPLEAGTDNDVDEHIQRLLRPIEGSSDKDGQVSDDPIDLIRRSM
ncbi:hypothetical protein B0H21DRAFT_826279 [Amylocystis lapponica]|nr:hypothetical protein B0H21DRAFT_826279 [Amylocystis lapponica]